MRVSMPVGLGLVAVILLPAAAALAANSAASQFHPDSSTNLTFSPDSGVSPEASSSDSNKAGHGSSDVGTAGTPKPTPSGTTGGNLEFNIPKVVFGGDDGLPATLPADGGKGPKESATGAPTPSSSSSVSRPLVAHVMAWVAPGVNDATATLYVDESPCAAAPARGGTVTRLSCPIGPVAAGDHLVVKVVVTSASRDALGSISYRHRIGEPSR